MKRVLILTAGYGEGHNAAARALAEGTRALGAEAEVRDLFLEAYGHRQETMRRLYLMCIDRAPWLWAAIFRLVDCRPLGRLSMRGLWPLKKHLAAVLRERQPCAVASVYPAYGHLLDQLFPGGDAPFSQHTIVTDSISVNTIWHTRTTRSYIVPNEATAAVLRAARIPAEKVHPLGFPVPPAFADARPLRPPPGAGEPLHVLFMVNHLRAGAAALVRSLLEMPHLRLSVTVGRDEALARELRAAAAGRPLEVLGWVKNMPTLLMRHHLLIGKAGGAATQETLAAGTPFLITQIVPGQEEGNARLVLEGGAGTLATTPAAIAETLAALPEANYARWHHWAAAAAKLGKPDAAREVARHLLGDCLSAGR